MTAGGRFITVLNVDLTSFLIILITTLHSPVDSCSRLNHLLCDLQSIVKLYSRLHVYAREKNMHPLFYRLMVLNWANLVTKEIYLQHLRSHAAVSGTS